MRSLADCIRAHGKLINRDDARTLEQMASEAMARSPKGNSALMAAREMMQGLIADRQQILNQIEQAGGNRAEWEQRLSFDEIEFNPQLNELAKGMETEFAEWATGLSWQEIKLIYDSMDQTGDWIENTHGGKVLSADASREMSERYRKNRLLADAMHEVSSAIIKRLYRERLAQPAMDDEVWLFMAGGPASGKSSALGLSEWSDPASLIYDGVLGNYQKDSLTKIDPALDSGRDVAMMYVYQNPIAAFRGSLMRAQDMKDNHGSGRPVGLENFVGGTVGANVSIRQHIQKYGSDPRVSFSFWETQVKFDENGKHYVEANEVGIDQIPQLSRADLEAELRSVLEEMRQTGEIDEEIFNYSVNQPLRESEEDYATGGPELEQEAGPAQPSPEPEVSEAAVDQGAGEVQREAAPITPEIQRRHAQMRMALARPIRQLAGTLDVQLLHTRAELPENARPAEDPDGETVEGFWLRGTDEAFLVAENIESIQRAQQVLAHEAFGHYAMEQMPEFNDILKSIQNLKTIGNVTVTQAAARVAATQGNLDATNEAKEILATMVERGVRSSTIDRAIASARRVLRRLGINLQFNEAEIRQLIVEGARGLQSQARAKQRALANMPAQQQILEDPASVESAIRNAIEEIYARSVLQDMTLLLHEGVAEGNVEAQRILDRQRSNPSVGPEVMFQRAYHGTGAPEFDRFDINYIGTGEGAASYGYGLYFSSKRGIANWYRRKLSGGYLFSYGDKAGLTGEEARMEVMAELFAETRRHTDNRKVAEDAAHNVAGAVMGMYNRHAGDLSAVRAELEQQANNYLRKAEGAQRLWDDDVANNRETDWGIRGAEAVIEADRVMAEAFDRAKEVTNNLFAERRAGSLMEVEIPETEDMIRYEDKLTEHSPEVQDKIRAEYPELFEEMWLNSFTGKPVDEQMIPEGMGEAELELRGFMFDYPYDNMTGEDLYKYIGETIAEREEPGFLNAMFAGFQTHLAERVTDKLASEKLRSMGIPGHSFIGASSGDLNYVIYDDSMVTITAVNDVQRPIRTEESQQAIDQAGPVGETVFSRNVGKKPCGKCFENSGRWMLHNDVPGARLVQGYVTGQGPIEGVRFAHAWVEIDGPPVEGGTGWTDEMRQQYGRIAVDRTTDERNESPLELPAYLYREIAQAEVVKEYSRDEALKMMAKHHHWGPWEFEETAEAEAVARGEDPYGGGEQMFSRRMSPYLQINDKSRNLPPQLAAKEAFPKDLEPAQYWALASEAGTRAYGAGEGSWENRYYRELGRFATQGATRMKKSPTEQMALFSRMTSKATAMAFQQHEGQTDYAGMPYFPHVHRVGLAGRDDIERATGFLHDIVEDTGTTVEDLRGEFPDEVVNAVEALTWDEEGGESYDDYMARVLANPVAAAVKFYDTRDNMRLSGFNVKTGEPVAKSEMMRQRTYNAMVKAHGAMQGEKPPLLSLEEVEQQQGRIVYSRSAMRVQPVDSAGVKRGPRITVLKNPSANDLRLFAANIKDPRLKEERLDRWNDDRPGLRWLHNYKDGNWYFWEAADSIHAGVRNALNIDINTTERSSEDIISREEINAGEWRGYTPPGKDEMVARMRARKQPAPRPEFSRRVRGSDRIEAIREKVMAPAQEDIGTKDRFRDVVNYLRGIEWLNVKQGIIDSAASVEAIERRLHGGELLDASESAYKSVLATKNLGSVMAAVMHRGIPILRNGVFQPKNGRKGFIEIFNPITQHSDGNLLPLWELYSVAYRAQRLINEKNRDGTIKEKLMTQDEINEALALGNQYPEFEVARREWAKLNEQTLDLAVKTGVINAEERKIWAKNDYVPFYRALEEIEYNEEGQGPRRGGTGVEGVNPRIRRLTGSEQKIGNVFENMIMNTAYLIDASFRNDAMQRIVMMADGVAMEKMPPQWKPVRINNADIARALMKAGLIVGNGVTQADMLNDAITQVKAMTPQQKAQWSTFFQQAVPAGENVVSVRMQGKPVYYEVNDPLLLRTVAGLGAHQWGGIMHLFRGSKKLLTSAVTIDPAFMMANFVRDTLSSWVVADTGSVLPPFAQAIKGAKAAFSEDEDTLAIMMAGAGGGGFYDHNPAEVRKMLAKKMPKGKVDAFANSIITPRGAWRFWQKIGNAAEQANRVAKYRRVLADGGTPAEAAYQARDILNFTMSGDYAAMKFLVQSVPFLNARIQGLYRLWRGGKENPFGFWMKGMSIMGASMALALRNMDDDKYEELPEWDKDTYWHFFIGDEHFRLPKPFEVGAMFGTMPERMMRSMAGRDDWELFGERFFKMVAETLQFNPTPQLVKPVVEQYANRNMFTGAPIVGFNLQGLKPEAQYDHWTSETMREWAAAMPEMAPEWIRSPKRLEAAVRAYTGAVGMYALGVSDGIVRRAMGHPDRPARAVQDMPVVRRFWRNPQPRTSKYTSELYDMLKEADALLRTMNSYESQGRISEIQELLEGNQGKLAARKFLHSVATEVREINAQMKVLAYSDASPKLKQEQMDKLNAAKLEAVRQVAHVAELF